MSKMDERILVVDRGFLFDHEMSTFQGVLTDVEKVGYLMTKFHRCFEVRRGDAEENEGWKQPIIYMVIKRGKEVFVYERLRGGGENRLHNQKSIGIGGHINNINKDWNTTFELNAYRELFEELWITNFNLHDIKVVGLINDDENAVGRVHIGILTLIELPEECEVFVREINKIKGDWTHIDRLLEDGVYNGLETWSQFVVKVLFG